jgi:malate dehydrogenase (oxaloacetate-decarboxylating)
VAQANNAMVFPGLGLGVAVSRARRVSDGMLTAAAHAIARIGASDGPGAPLLPPVENLRAVSAEVGIAVARAAEKEGLADRALTDPVRQIHEARWRPAYPLIEPI